MKHLPDCWILHVVICSGWPHFWKTGDFRWLVTIWLYTRRTDVEYTGYDIVEANIEGHRITYKDKPWKFEVRRDKKNTVRRSKKWILYEPV